MSENTPNQDPQPIANEPVFQLPEASDTYESYEQWSPGPDTWRPDPDKGLPTASNFEFNDYEVRKPSGPKPTGMKARLGALAVAGIATVGAIWGIGTMSGTGEAPSQPEPAAEAEPAPEAEIVPQTSYDEAGPLVQDVSWVERISEENTDDRRYYETQLANSEASPEMASANIKLFITKEGVGADKEKRSNGTSSLIRLETGELALLTVDHVLDAEASSMHAWIPSVGTVSVGTQSSYESANKDSGEHLTDPAKLVPLSVEVQDIVEQQIETGKLVAFELAGEAPVPGELAFSQDSYTGEVSAWLYLGPSEAKAEGNDSLINSPGLHEFVGVGDTFIDEFLVDGKLSRDEFEDLMASFSTTSEADKRFILSDVDFCKGDSGRALTNIKGKIVGTMSSMPAGKTEQGHSRNYSNGVVNCAFVVGVSPVTSGVDS